MITQTCGQPITVRRKKDLSMSAVRYSRCCEICTSENPKLRAFYTICGHVVCKACAIQLADSQGKQKCPFCRRATSYTTLHENVVGKNQNPLQQKRGEKHSDILRPLKDECCSLLSSLWELISEEIDKPSEKDILVNRMRTEDAARSTLALRYSRRCSLCNSENPQRRAASTACGHIVCKKCAERGKGGKRLLMCPNCKMPTTYKVIFEDVMTESESSAISSGESNQFQYKPKRRPSKCSSSESIYTADICDVNGKSFHLHAPNMEYKTIEEASAFEMIAYAVDHLNQRSPHLLNCTRMWDREIKSRLEEFRTTQSREYTRTVVQEIYKYMVIFLTGRKPVLQHMKTAVFSGMMAYNSLSDEAKADLKPQFPEVNQDSFRKLIIEFFHDVKDFESILH